MIKKQPSRIATGIFVLGAFALIVIGLSILGGIRIFTKHPVFVMYFEGSVKGLNVGAPVVFRGVKIGTVTDISLRFDPDSPSVQIPVLIELYPDSITSMTRKIDVRKYITTLSTQGLKAQLKLQNLITGQLIIELDFHPGKPVKLVNSETRYPEIPTITSSFEEFTNALVQLPLDELITKLISAVEGIDRMANSQELAESFHTMNQTLKDLQHLIKGIDSRIDPIASGIEATVGDAQNFVRNFDKQISSLQSNIDLAAKAARGAMLQAEKTFDSIENITSGDSALIYQMTRTLEELSAAARSIRAWTDYLERHPEALIRGKSGSEGR
ncbi:MAG TPA: MCE family protein [Deltaproteobacteria bacterium]|nr:MCE family protein [Deltaproteobacteria bacterium]